MRIQKILFALTLVGFLAIGCKNETKKDEATKTTTEAAADVKELSLAISGMTCEMGCAKKIASDLSKKEGVLKANVVFTDSIATIKYDANITSKTDLIAFVDGIADGKTYKATETAKKACKEGCTMPCCATKNVAKKACKSKADCKKENCTEADKKACKEKCDSKKECTKKMEDKKACASDCKKECCTTKKA